MLVYMSVWSIVMVLFFGMTRARRGAQIVVMAAVAGLALLVMPCGWLGPVLGLHVVNRGETADA